MKKTITAFSISLLLSTTFVWATEEVHMDHSKMDSVDGGQIDHNNMSTQNMSDVGMLAKGAKPDKVVYVTLSDEMTITFKKEVTIEPNDVVQFIVVNKGSINHEFTIGSEKEQLAHRDMMKSDNHGGHGDHESDNSITVAPNKTKQITWHFHGQNKVVFACNIAGHAESGMVKKITL